MIDGPSEAGSATEVDRIRAVVLGCPGVVDLSAGPFGEIASYLRGRTVAGIRSDADAVEVHIIAEYGGALQDIADGIGTALRPLLDARPLTVAVEDILLPGESNVSPGPAE